MNDLTPYEKRMLEEDRKVWKGIALSTAKIDRELAQETILKIRRAALPDGPSGAQFVWCESPSECVAQLAAYSKMDLVQIGRVFAIPYLNEFFAHDSRSETQVMVAIKDVLFGDVSLDGYRKAAIFGQLLANRFFKDMHGYYAGDRRTDDVTQTLAFYRKNTELIGDFIRNCSFALNFDNYVFCSERPTVIAIDDRERLHNKKGPALAWGEKEQHFRIHGIEVPSKYVTDPRTINPPAIDATKNIEVRRVLMEIYGIDKYLQCTGAQVISEGIYGKRLWWRGPEHETPEQARIWRVLGRIPEPLVMVEVINSTPEPDGSYKRYFLRVPPHIRDADEAVAWTFRLKKEDYHPDVET